MQPCPIGSLDCAGLSVERSPVVDCTHMFPRVLRVSLWQLGELVPLLSWGLTKPAGRACWYVTTCGERVRERHATSDDGMSLAARRMIEVKLSTEIAVSEPGSSVSVWTLIECGAQPRWSL